MNFKIARLCYKQVSYSLECSDEDVPKLKPIDGELMPKPVLNTIAL